MTAVGAPALRAARTRFYPLTVARVDRMCADAAALTFDVPAGLASLFGFSAGQWVTVRRDLGGREERRSYSICAAVGARPRIGVRAVPGGTVSEWLAHRVVPGDVVEVAPPAGTFTPDLSTSGRHVLLAAGSGITPLLSIAASLLARPGNRVTLCYANRRADTVMFSDELADLKDAHPERLQLLHLLSREALEVELFSGRLDAPRIRALRPLLPATAWVDHWWLCGPYGMVTEVSAVLREWDVPAERVHRELFYVEEEPPEHRREPEVVGAVGAEVTVVLDGRSTLVRVPPGVPVLDGAQRARADLPFACKGGVCGTCRARVVAGVARMRRNFALEPAELRAGYVLTCQALPVTDSLTVDYDS